ncbi:hypothetical protein B0A49_08209, partial [Cryomyces minteri]
PPLPTPPAPEAPPMNSKGASTPPQSRVSTPQPTSRTRRGMRRQTPVSRQSDDGPANPSLPTSLLDSSVPPINVLIVEDNIINLKLLEAFMKRLKVRWQTAMNGQIAVQKWRTGGFHLVLMDIQLPIMSGLEATKEIRRLERVNGVGVFSNASASALASASKRKADAAKRAAEGEVDGDDAAIDADANGELGEQDKLQENAGLFKSPVIIVALTASSLQSDRHEALAVGCNDFLTKPVNFVWLERKVKEWGCMQALIDFDGWRKWKDFAAQNGQPSENSKKDAGKKAATKTAENATAAKMDKEKKKAAGAGAKVGMAGKKVEGTGVDGGGAVDSVGLDMARSPRIPPS